MNETTLEQCFYRLHDCFLKLNLHVQSNYKTDSQLKAILKEMLDVHDDIGAHYYYDEIERVRVKSNDGEGSTH